MSVVKAIGFIVVFISAFILFFLLDSLQKITEKCERNELRKDLCEGLKKVEVYSLTFILLIATSILIILSTSYQILMKAWE